MKSNFWDDVKIKESIPKGNNRISFMDKKTWKEIRDFYDRHGSPEKYFLRCFKCDMMRVFVFFHRNRSKKSGFESRCKKCVSRFKSKKRKQENRKTKVIDSFQVGFEDRPNEYFFIKSLETIISSLLEEGEHGN
jgi:hypothetical protein